MGIRKTTTITTQVDRTRVTVITKSYQKALTGTSIYVSKKKTKTGDTAITFFQNILYRKNKLLMQ